MKRYIIRRLILNMTMAQWDKFGKRESWTGTASKWFKKYGLCGCSTARTNDQEKLFFSDLMMIGHQYKNKKAMESFEKDTIETSIAMG